MASITLNISAAKYTVYKSVVLFANPVPKGMDGQPLMTEDEWIKELLRSEAVGVYVRSKHIKDKAEDTASDGMVTI